MKRFKTKIAALAIVLVTAGPTAAGELAPAKNCTWCHGVSAQGFFLSPRLAGQKPEYIENQLLKFLDHSRNDPEARNYMWPAAAHLTPEAARAFAAYFSSLAPTPADDGQKELIAAGRRIFELGIPSENVVQCVACHGPQAEGIRQIPRLGGLSYSYLKKRLEQWQQGLDASAAPMPLVAKVLSPQDIDALASYLSFAQ
jgi:cytochrome c553